MYSATYSPEDNKLRLYSSTRLDKPLYERVRAAGFIWAPKQDLFVAPAWSPSREDLLLELAGEIDDEDKSLVERQEERAERFEGYKDARAEDAEQARKAVHAIADGIPLGQPILVGHHSEKHARKDAERIENGMRRAVKMWETSQYWKDRAAGAIRHAKYKERPDVRARRIKGIEADIRSYRAKFTPADNPPHIILQEPWDKSDGVKVPHVWCAPRGGRGGSWVPVENLSRLEAYYSRWIRHCENRLEYERAMIAESGGTESDKTRPEVGGACRCWSSPGYGKGWSFIQKVNKVSVTLLDTWGNGGGYFNRTMPFDKLHAVMSKAEVEAMRAAGRILHEDTRGFYLSGPEPEKPGHSEPEQVSSVPPQKEAFEAMKDTLRAGVQVVSAPQLFPTPPDLAARMVELARIEKGQRILEPSVGTGNIARAIFAAAPVTIVAIEANPRILESFNTIHRSWGNPRIQAWRADFLECNENLGNFDRVVMNPPFENASDIKHIKHALTMLRPGGRLVAICANGPRQQEQLQPIADSWEELPTGTFAGTGVRAVLLTIEKGEA